MGDLSTSERIKLIKRELKLKTNVQLGVLAGAKKTVVGFWLSGEIQTIAPHYAFALESKTPFRAKWIMLGEGPERKDASFTHPDENIQTVIELMEGATERTRIEVCGVVRNYINTTSTAETEQKVDGLTGTHS